MERRLLRVAVAVTVSVSVAFGCFFARKYQIEREIHLFDCRMKEWKRQSEHREGM